MKSLLTADLHISERVLDEHRWGIFKWLGEQAVANGVQRVNILGDLADSKDRHSEKLVSRMVHEIKQLARKCPVHFLPGNHDGIHEGKPFFRFLEEIEGVDVHHTPTKDSTAESELLYLPHTRDHKTAWAGLDFAQYDTIFCHQTFDGCLTENGTRLSGIPASVFGKTKAKIYSGDIHVPQKIGRNIEYVGAPYRVRFGDDFMPRVLLIDDNSKERDLQFPTVFRWLFELDSIDPVKEFEFDARSLVKSGDQVKVRCYLERSRFPEWPSIRAGIREAAARAKITLLGPELHAKAAKPAKGPEKGHKRPQRATPAQALEAHAKKEGLSAAFLSAGREYLGGGDESV